MKIQTVFERTEKKYILTLSQRRRLLEMVNNYIKPDEYGESTVCSLYFDTPDSRLIRQSMEKPVYKEKLRLRSYSTPKAGSNVFLELKKKYNGVVYKRRKTLEYTVAKSYIENGVLPDDSQIMREIDWTMHYYKRFRTDNLDLGKGHYGERILDRDLCIMEIKALSAMPLWLTDALSELHVFPGTFSKYGTAYQITEQRKNDYDNAFACKGGLNCA